MILVLLKVHHDWFQTRQPSKFVSTCPLKFNTTNQPDLAATLVLGLGALIVLTYLSTAGFNAFAELFMHDRNFGADDAAILLSCFLAIGWLLVYLAFKFTYREETELSREGIEITKDLLRVRQTHQIPIDELLYYNDQFPEHPFQSKYLLFGYGNPQKPTEIYFGQNLSEHHFELVLEYVKNYEIWLI